MAIEIKLAGISSSSAADRVERLSMLIWGKSGSGKTVLASTAPGKHLWINFDPDGAASLTRSDATIVVDFSGITHATVPQFKSGDTVEAQLRTALKDNPDIHTVVIDSVTSFSQLALSHAVLSGKANGGTFKATMELPGMQGYGVRNRLVLDMVNMFLRLTAEQHRNIIFICHEDTPNKDKEGNITSISLLLGGTLPEEVPLKISECWYLADADGRRTIGIRPYGMRTPMRTRMFLPNGKTNFPFTYEQATNKGEGIATWYERWKAAGFSKIPCPG